MEEVDIDNIPEEKYVPPTYEQYIKATAFARFRYKWGLFVMIGCWVCLLILIGFVYLYQNELSASPPQYALSKINADYCKCYIEDSPIEWYFNSTTTMWKDTSRGTPTYVNDWDLMDFISNKS